MQDDSKHVIRNALDSLARFAGEHLEGTGSVNPMVVFTFGQMRLPLVAEGFPNDASKDGFMTTVRALTATYGPDAVAFLCEVWMSVPGETRSPQSKPSEDPDRIEAVLIHAETPSGSGNRILRMRRHDDGSFSCLEDYMDDETADQFSFAGRFCDFYASEQLDTETRKWLDQHMRDHLGDDVVNSIVANVGAPGRPN